MTDIAMENSRLHSQAQQAEDALIGAALMNPSVMAVVDLTPADFVSSNGRIVWQAIVDTDLAGPVDMVTVHATLSRLTGGRDWAKWLSERVSNTPSAANAKAYAGELRILRQKLVAIRLCQEAVSKIPGGDSSVVDGLIGALMELTSDSRNYEFTMRESLKAALDLMESARKGDIQTVPTGLIDLDSKLGGFHKSDLVVVGARPAMGKTAMLLNFALNANRPVGIISSEQPHDQVGMRTLAIGSGVGLGRLRAADLKPHEWGLLSPVLPKYSAVGIHINDKSGISIVEVVRQARKWRHAHRIEALYVDYIQRIKSADQKAKRHEQVGEVVRGLKELARELDIPVVALAQVSRDVEKRQDKHPHMGDMSDSSEIEKEADQIMTLYREEVYNPETMHKGIMEISIEKNRHGPTGDVKVVWDGACQRVRNLAPEAS